MKTSIMLTDISFTVTVMGWNRTGRPKHCDHYDQLRVQI
jgi:hypothetical protein